MRDIAERLHQQGMTTAQGTPIPTSYIHLMLQNPFYMGRFAGTVRNIEESTRPSSPRTSSPRSNASSTGGRALPA